MVHPSAGYDDFAYVYDAHWGERYAQEAIIPLERILFPRLPSGANILDLCCGSGRISRLMADRGYRVTGLDSSPALIKLARQNAPLSEFVIDDVRTFELHEQFEGVISLNDSLNHVLSEEELRKTFKNVHRCMKAGGALLFDLNLSHKYLTSWAGSFAIVEEDMACAVIASVDTDVSIAHFKATIFAKENTAWSRKDAHLRQTWYSPEQITFLLSEIGFDDVCITDRTGKMISRFDVDRAFFACTRR